MSRARRSRPMRREMSSSTCWLANALSKMTNGRTETSKPAPNNMAWPAKSSSLSCLTKLCATDPSDQFRAADSACGLQDAMAVFPAERQADDPDGRAAPSRCSLPTPRHRTSQKSGLPGLAEAEAGWTRGALGEVVAVAAYRAAGPSMVGFGSAGCGDSESLSWSEQGPAEVRTSGRRACPAGTSETTAQRRCPEDGQGTGSPRGLRRGHPGEGGPRGEKLTWTCGSSTR